MEVADMFGRILVCLDGSDLAEQVVPYARVQASQFGSEVHLLRAIEKRPREKVTTGSEGTEAAAYLDTMAESLRKDGIAVTCATVEGTAGEAILTYSNRCKVDLIAMATHGRSGLGRAVLGSIASSVLRGSNAPILIIRPRETGVKTAGEIQPLKKILVCLDGSRLAEQVMPFAASQTLRFQAQLVLLQVVSGPLDYSPGTTGAAPVEDARLGEMTKEALNSAKAYLEQIAAPLRKQGIHVNTTATVGRAGETILGYAGRHGMNLIAIATHGRSGLGQALYGSVADHVLRESGLPIFLVRCR
jgi:nucleotide-binding universal stress UspA family protein